MQTVQIGNQSFLPAAQYGTHGISSFGINNNTGALTRVDDLGAAQGLGIHTPTTFEILTAFGQTWVIVGSASSSTLSVLEISDDGQLTAVDHLLDTLSTRFGGVQPLATAQVDDHVFVVAGGADDGLSLFTLLPDGRLIHLETIAHQVGTGLMKVGEINITVMGDTLQIFVTSGTDAGISRSSIDVSTLGDDLLIAGQNDTVFGGDGDDILVVASGAQFNGGAGADRFVMEETESATRILDFTRGEDIIDMSSYFMLRSADQITVNGSSLGARVQARDTLIEVRSSDVMSLSAEDLFGRTFDWADRIPILEATYAPHPPAQEPDPVTTPDPPTGGGSTAPGVVLTGGGGADILLGGSADDTISGGQGRDELSGQGGNDWIGGDSGHDTLQGGTGNDTMSGNEGNDILRGGTGDDIVMGNDGDDGADTVSGSWGDDQIYGGGGNDAMWGGWGNDMMGGSEGNDLLYGEAGNDTVWGGAQNDRLYGNDGVDTVGGFGGDDLAHGDRGDDFVWGNFGNDTLYGNEGNDLLGGTEGVDLIFGGNGNDDLRGGEGNDWLSGGWGSDTFQFTYNHVGANRIADFNPNVDVIQIEAGPRALRDLNMRQQGDDVVITLPRGQITVVDTELSDLGWDQFLFG